MSYHLRSCYEPRRTKQIMDYRNDLRMIIYK
jgi:hypothetical protein